MFSGCFCCCSVHKSCPTLCNLMNCSMPGSPVLHYLQEFAQIHIHWVGDAIQLSHPLMPPSPPVLNLSPHQGLFQWAGSSHQVAKVLKLQHLLYLVAIEFFVSDFLLYVNQRHSAWEVRCFKLYPPPPISSKLIRACILEMIWDIIDDNHTPPRNACHRTCVVSTKK